MFVLTHREHIAALASSGLSQRAIAKRLGIAPATVSYHLRRLCDNGNVLAPPFDTQPPPAADPPRAEHASAARSGSETRGRVAELLARGMRHAEIAQRLGVSKATVSYHVRRLGCAVDERCARRYDWDAVQCYYDAGHSVRECIALFGFSSASWFDAVKRGAIVARPSATPIADLLVAGTYRGRYSLKLRLLREGLKHNRCERCGLGEWCGQPITLALHHVNGERDDNRLENLQLLCPNCHSQTDNYAGRNGRSGRAQPLGAG